MKSSFTPPLVAVLATLVGCTQYLPSVGPDYREPAFELREAVLPDAGFPTTNLTVTGEYAPAVSNVDDRVVISTDTIAQWWKRFDDPVLENLVIGAVSNNASFRLAQARLEQANWELLGTYSAFLPKLGVNASWTHNVLRHNNPSAYNSTRPGDSVRSRTAQLGLGADWELDIFGGSRRQTEAALALAESAEWTVADAWISLTTQIGAQYVNLRTVQESLSVARTNLVLQSETLEILRSRLESGIGDELAVNQCAYIVEQTRAQIPQLLAQEESLKNAIAILAGEMPGSIHDALVPVSGRDWLLAPQKVSELPLDLLRSRPDVKAVERRLAAQTARIGVAKAMWFPKLFISGSVGYQARNFRDLFSPESVMSSFGPSISWPIFQAGAIYSSVKAEEAKTRQALLDYELALERAYADVRNAYSAYTQEYHRYQSLQGAVKAATDAVTISRDLYRNGLKDFNNVLDAQRSRLQLEAQLVASRGQITIDLIDLYRALGGGLAVER